MAGRKPGDVIYPEPIPESDEGISGRRSKDPTSWRIECLRTAGYPDDHALALALDRSVDLHKACSVATEGGADVGWRIFG